MKRLLKTLCAVLGTATMIYATPVFSEQKFKVPEYDLKDAKKLVDVIETLTGKEVMFERYILDRNKDGKVDLLKFNVYQISKEGYTNHSFTYLYIDDDLDGYVDRVLVDQVKEDGTEGVDGIYDREEIMPKNLSIVEY